MSKSSKKKVGRPTKYKESFPEDLLEFFNQPLFIEIEVEKMSASGAIKTLKERVANDMPLFKCFCREIGINFDTFNEWTRQYPRFSDAYKQCKGIQERFIMAHSLGGRYNASFAKFFAINNLGMREQSHLTTENEHKVEGYGLAFDLSKKPEDLEEDK